MGPTQLDLKRDGRLDKTQKKLRAADHPQPARPPASVLQTAHGAVSRLQTFVKLWHFTLLLLSSGLIWRRGERCLSGKNSGLESRHTGADLTLLSSL